MSGTIELDPDGKNLQIRFPYRQDLVEEVKTIPGRRWDRGGKMWRVPCEQIDNVVSVFMRHGFQMTSEVSGLLAGTTGTATPPPDTSPAATSASDKDSAKDKDEAPALSISNLNQQVQAAIKGAFPQPVWVVGEIIDFDKNKDRQHIFFTLAEKTPGNHSIAAQVSVAMFERTATKLRSKLEQAAEPVTLCDGIEVRALVRVDLYPKNGRYQCIIEDIDPSFTLGKIALTREEILRELRQKGLDQINQALPLPTPALRIGVLASLDSDGWNDFLKEFDRAGLGFQLTCYAVKVQGELLQSTMCQGLRWFAERSDQFDALCIIRGGGSRTDLAWFDNREVAMAVAQHPLKIVCGIGHQRDQSVLDLCCHSEKTPTAAAAFLIQQVQLAQQELADLGQQLRELAKEYLQAEATALQDMGHNLRRFVQARLLLAQQQIQQGGRRLLLGSRQFLRRQSEHVLRASERLRSGSQHRLTEAHNYLQTQATKQRLLDPKVVLQRGYTLVRDDSGRILVDSQSLQVDQSLRITFRDGEALTRVEKVSPNK